MLEMIGDLPDADMKPPENVLFVCKLNPVTTDDDLEIIFTRSVVARPSETTNKLVSTLRKFSRREGAGRVLPPL